MAKYKMACATVALAITGGVGLLGSTGAWADGEYDLVDCIVNGTEDVCTLTSDTIMNDWVQPMRNLTIDLNGHTLTTDKAFNVYRTELNITGNGVIEEVGENVIPFYVYGSIDESDSNFTVLNIGSGVTVKSPYYGFFVPNLYNHAYGVVVNFGGRLEAQDGITINGNIQDAVANAPQINILDGASIVADGHPIYAAGYGHWNIGAATISGSDGVGIKAGTFNFTNTEITTTGNFVVPEGYNNGIYSAGTPIQIESNDGYADHVEITINGGEYASENGAVILEYKAKVDTQNTVKSLEITGGTFVAGGDEDIFHVSDGFTLTKFVSGGVFNKPFDPGYLTEGYSAYEKPQDVWTVDVAQEANLPDKIVIAKGETYTIEPGSVIAKYLVGGTVDKEIATSDGLTITGVAAGETAFTAQLHEMGKGIDTPIPVYVYDVDDESADVRVVVDSTSIEEGIDEGIVLAISDELGDKKLVGYYDISAAVMNGNEEVELLHNLGSSIEVRLNKPANLPAVQDGFTRKYYVIRYHNGETTTIEAYEVDGKIGFMSDGFSTFALAYEDVEDTAAPETGTVTREGGSAMVASVVVAVFVGVMTSVVSFAYLIRKK